MAKYTIHPVPMGTKEFDKGMMTYQHDYGKPYTIPIYSWVIKGGDKNILVDTGEMSPIQTEDREKAIGGKIYTFEQGLEKHGLTPKDIDIVLHTHLHNDHCENDYKCENAKFYVHESEIKSISDPHPLDFRYNMEFFEDVLDAGQVQVLTGDTEVLEGITMIHTPAHTPGGMSIAIDTDKGKAIITGFCLIMENFFPPKEVLAMEMEVIPPGTNVNTYEAYDIVKKIKEMADIIIPLHEPKFASGAAIPE